MEVANHSSDTRVGNEWRNKLLLGIISFLVLFFLVMNNMTKNDDIDSNVDGLRGDFSIEAAMVQPLDGDSSISSNTGTSTEQSSVVSWLGTQSPTAEILAFGDSLTYGMSSREYGDQRYPYAAPLAALLHGPQVSDSGVVGQLASDMSARLLEVLKEHPNTKVVCILAGTNDLGHRSQPDAIAQSIIDLHAMAQTYFMSDGVVNSRIVTVVMTIPQISWRINQQHRLDVNALLRTYASTCQDRTILVDLENAWDQKNMEENEKFWSSDFVHLSENGYKDMARLVYEALNGKGETENSNMLQLPYGSSSDCNSEVSEYYG